MKDLQDLKDFDDGAGGHEDPPVPGGKPWANRWFLKSTPIQMPPEPGASVGD